MNCKNNGNKAAHDHLDDCVRDLARPAHVNYTNEKELVPSHADSNKKGDALTTLSRDAWPQVLDFTLVHPCSGSGVWDSNALQNSVNRKMDKHNGAYFGLGFTFVACAVTTFGVLHQEFLRLLYILARRQAEVIVSYHRPDADFADMLGMCFAANRAKVGAAVARGMAMRALSYCKQGVRRFRVGQGLVPYGHVDQQLDIMGAPGVDVASLAPAV